ncbi:MAG TPA: ribosome maturation factor RimM [Nevskiales bacterium]|nr:ribosome maturation factor RimM [Nevskiales bacterium]
MGADANRRIVLGRIVGVFGVKGWVKLESWTRPPENILGYRQWQLGRAGRWQVARLIEGRRQGRGLVAQLADESGSVCDDRDRAAALVGSEIAVMREALPALGPNEFYWADLLGLEVETLQGRRLGRVRELLETPAHDMLVVGGETGVRWIPCVLGPIVKSVDLAAGRIQVDWDPDAVE